MSDNTCIVVGDCFSHMVDNVKIFSPSYFKHSENQRITFENMYFAQGVSQEDECYIIQKFAHSKNNLSYLNHVYWIDNRHVHKCNKSNVLISEILRDDDENYSFKVRIDKENELISDHVTGIHIPAMLLMEASRQSLIAIMEIYFKDLMNNMRFVINSTSSSFIKYVFPYDIKGEVKLNFIKRTKLKSEFQASIEIKQLNNTCASLFFQASLTPEKIAFLTENMYLPKKINFDEMI